MKRVILFLLVAAMAISCGTKKNGTYTLEIYATNDLHAQFFDKNYNGEPRGNSLSNISGYINARRAELGDSAVMLIDVGDMLQGDPCAPFFAHNPSATDTIYDGEHYLANIMEFVGYDLGVVGNHDIEASHSEFDRLAKDLDCPYLGANVFDVASGKAYFKEYAIVERGGLRIAIIGLTTHWIDHWLDKSLYEGLFFKNPVEVADSLLPIVAKRERPDLIGIAVHCGTGNGEGLETENLGKYIAQNVAGVDFIFTSHDHTPFAATVENLKSGQKVSIVNSGAYARNLSKTSIKITYKEGKVVEKEIVPTVISMENESTNPDYDLFVEPYYNLVKEFNTRQIGTLERPVVFNDALIGYSDYINFINTIQIKHTGADISFAAPLKTNVVLPAGKVDYSTIMNIYPYENILYVISMTGKEIKDYLEYNYDQWIRSIKSPSDTLLNITYNSKTGKYRFKNPSFNFDAAKGINYFVDVTKPFGQRVEITSKADGTPFVIETKYRVAITSYRANGGVDIISKGAGIDTKNIESIVLDRFPGIREMIYNYFLDGGEFIYDAPANWAFIPANLTKSMLKRDLELVTK